MTGFEDLVIAARTVWGEARGELFEGQKAVVHVLLNRLAAGDHGAATLAAVCLRPLQFSCWNGGDPNRPKLLAAGLDDAAFRLCLRAVLEAMDEPDFTQGARWYYAGNAVPAWARGKAPCFTAGAHLFFNDIG
jgi:N-acetylmuramoyl-L-alanine amidase